MITPAQCIEGRRLLGWSRERLATGCDLYHTSLLRFEMETWFPKSEGLAAIQRGLEAAGVESTNSGAPGVKLRKQP
jgi:ribosome-binding protein aMBF1 (putative translation factor)